MQSEERRARHGIRQVHKKYFVETTFAQHFRRERGNIVGSRGKEYAALAILHPGQKSGQQSLRQSRISVTAGTSRRKSLFYFINPQHQWRHFLRQVQRFAQTLFAFADKFVVQSAGIKPRQFESPFSRDGFGGKAFAASLHAGNQNSFWRDESELLAFRGQRTLSFCEPFA